jgi:hypothetical protein
MSTDNVLVLPEVVMNDELAKAIHDATDPAVIRALLMAKAEKQHDTAAQLIADQATAAKAAADNAAADAAADAAALAAQPLRRNVTIGNQSFEFEGADEAELDRLELNAIKVAYAVRQPEVVPARTEVVPDAAAVAAAAEAELAAKAELDRKFRLGEISPAEYIQQTGAVKAYLEAEGVSIEALKETVNANKGAKFHQSWADAGEAFRNSAAGQDWPGGLKNQELIGMKIAALGLTEAEDKVAALAQAYAELKKTGLYFPNGDANTPAAAVVPAAAAATAAVVPDPASVEAARAVAAAKVRSMSSGVFGASSGTSGAPVVSPAVAAAKTVIPENATPSEIMAAYKQGLVDSGQDPNAAFLAARRANATR